MVCYPTYGGSGVVATELGMYLAKMGHKVHFITYSQPVRLDILEPNIYYHEVNVQDYPLFQYQPYELALSSKMVETVVNEKLDLLHVHYAIPHAYAAYMAREILADRGIHIPIITTLHGTDITLVGRNPSYKPAVTFSINHSDVVTSVSQSLCDDTRNLFGITRPIHVIPNFIDPAVFQSEKPCPRASLAPKGEKLLVHVSNFRKVKRIPDVIEVFARVAQVMPVRLVLLGDGPERERAEEQVKQLGLMDQVAFLGKTNEVERVLKAADLALLPSETESFGLAALESMAAGTPVLSTNTGGLPEVNWEGVSGYTFGVGDMEGMAHRAIALLNNPTALEALSQSARAHAMQFTIERVIPRYLEVYHEAKASVTSVG
jgi:N-acetyl-alpha-D-glucosaminyl L-malate synthase BshA